MATTMSWRKSIHLLLVCLLLLQFSPHLEGRKAEPLYSKREDDVVILEAKTFYETVLSSDEAWMIEFYSSWCGHCVHYAPTWKKFATDVKAWRSVIAVAAIDCADTKNHVVCQQEHVMGYPSIMEYPPHGKNGSSVKYKGGRDIPQLRQELVRYIITQHPLPHWPRVKPANTSDVFLLYEETKSSSGSAIFIIFEGDESVLGAEVMLDLSATPSLSRQILRLKSTDQPLVAKWSVPSPPALFVWPMDGAPAEIKVGNLSREGFVAAIRNYHKEIIPVKTVNETKRTPRPVNKPEVKSRITEKQEEEPVRISNETKNHTYLADLESALHYSLRMEVSLRKKIVGEDLMALRSYVSVLDKYFPAREPVAEFLSNINQKLKNTNDIDGIPIKSWIAWINSGKTSVLLPAEQNWVGCQGSSKEFRGYPCSLWTLFHVLTVIQAEVDQDNHDSNSLEVLQAMKDYIINFFSCLDCRRNFAKESAKLLSEVNDLDGAIMSLWRAHNRVNLRLKGDVTEDEAFPKVQFPSQSLCPVCYDSTDSSQNEQEVLRYLRQRYSIAKLNFTGLLPLSGPHTHPRQVRRTLDDNQLRRDIINRIERRKFTPKEPEVQKNFTMLGVTVFDVSICLMLNVCCIGLVIIVYLVFFRRRKLKACYSCLP